MYNHPIKPNDQWTELRQQTYHKGFVAGKIRQASSDNPYRSAHDEQAALSAEHWINGWTDAQTDRLT